MLRIVECAKRHASGAWDHARAAATIQRLLQRVETDALDEALAAWALALATGKVVVIGGKERHSAMRKGRDRAHLLAVTDQATGTVLGQVKGLAKTNEITQLAVLLEQLDQHRSFKGMIVTVDASTRKR